MIETEFRGISSFSIENEQLRVTVTRNGGQIAEIFHKSTGVSPLWVPPWPSLDVDDWRDSSGSIYGEDADSRLLASVMGHFVCLDTFGMPSAEEICAGGCCHGEAPLAIAQVKGSDAQLTCICDLPAAQLRFKRKIALSPSGAALLITETVENLSACDRAIAWTQHVTVGPSFLERGVTEFQIPDVRSMDANGRERPPEHSSTFTSAARSGGFVTHLIDPSREQGYFLSFSPRTRTLFGYVWRRLDFPWIGVWEENRQRMQRPWNGEVLARGMEFGVSPFPEPRRKMIERQQLFGTPCYRWVAAKSLVNVEYCAFVKDATTMPHDVAWDGLWGVDLW